MSVTEKVTVSGSALSFLLYECFSATNGEEGFLIGDITSELKNDISDSNSENTRLETDIIVKSIFPMPSVGLFYAPSGRVKEDVLNNLFSDGQHRVVGWYKYRKDASTAPTLRDRLLARSLQQYFERKHNNKNFATCQIFSTLSIEGSKHSFFYKFSKINRFGEFQKLTDVTPNLGDKDTTYKKPHRSEAQTVFNQIVCQVNEANDISMPGIFRLQERVDARLVKEAELAATFEHSIRDLEAEIKQMTSILSDRHASDITEAAVSFQKAREKEDLNRRERELVAACRSYNKEEPRKWLLNFPDSGRNHKSELPDSRMETDASPKTGSAVKNYASALRTAAKTESPKSNNVATGQLINFADDEMSSGDCSVTESKEQDNMRSSPEY